MSMLNRLVLVAGIALSFVTHSASLQGQQGGVINFYGSLTEAPAPIRYPVITSMPNVTVPVKLQNITAVFRRIINLTAH